MTISASSQKRVDRFVDDFIRSRYVEAWTNENEADFFNNPERAERVANAAEYGANGSTHAEIIDDWRNAFKTWVKYDRRVMDIECKTRTYHYHNHEYPERFADAVLAHFDSVEQWHERNGSLWQEIG